jgi:hypothetical protein
MGCKSEGSEFESPYIVKSFLSSVSSRLALGPTKPPVQCIPGTLPPGVKQEEHETDHSLVLRSRQF